MSVDVAAWAAARPLVPAHVDCATAVMLKIIDGKCKMAEGEKRTMAAFYDAVKDRPGVHLGADIHALIARTRQGTDEATRLIVYEKRVLAETMIARPTMKAFKAMLRAEGLFAGMAEDDEEVA
jgi:hypothetical protein